MSNELQTAGAVGKLSTWVERPEVRQRVSDMLGGVIDPGTFVSHMLTAFQDDTLSRCTDKSKFEALHVCAAMALLPTLDQVRLIPYKNVVKAMPQWQGYKAVMERHPDILEVMAELVHVTDEFRYENGVVRHAFDPFDPKRVIDSDKDIRGGYCTIVYTDGRRPKYHFTPVAHITKARNCAQTQKVWGAWYKQMALKTCYRDCYARRAVPVDPMVQSHLAAITRADDDALRNDPSRVVMPEGGRMPAEKLAARLKGEPIDDPETEDTTVDVEPEDEDSDNVSEIIELIGSANGVNEVNAIAQDIRDDVVIEGDDEKALLDLCEKRIADIRAKRGKGSNAANGELFDNGPGYE